MFELVRYLQSQIFVSPPPQHQQKPNFTSFFVTVQNSETIFSTDYSVYLQQSLLPTSRALLLIVVPL